MSASKQIPTEQLKHLLYPQHGRWLTTLVLQWLTNNNAIYGGNRKSGRWLE